VSDDLTSTTGVIALVAGGIGLIALLSMLALWRKISRLQANQQFLLGDGGERDLVAHAQSLQQNFDQLHSRVQNATQQLDDRIAATETRLNRAISHSAVIRYDAYNELSGRQSSSIALLDDNGTGVVMSSILHREQARVYVKGVRDGKSELELSPEETEAIQSALGRRDGQH
jgi:Protein of unknown function (DUF4446)